MTNYSGTPIVSIQEFHLNQDELNKKLEKYVLDEMKLDNELNKIIHNSNIGGWQSSRDLHIKLEEKTENGALLLQLFQSFSDPITKYINKCCEGCNIPTNPAYDWNYAGSWFNVYRKGFLQCATYPPIKRN